MKKVVRVGTASALLLLAFVLSYTIAADHGDGVTSGTYHFAQNGETSTLVLKPDHSFQQELHRAGKTGRAEGVWRRMGEGGIDFSKEFLLVSGQEPGPHGKSYGDIHKDLGLLVSIKPVNITETIPARSMLPLIARCPARLLDTQTAYRQPWSSARITRSSKRSAPSMLRSMLKEAGNSISMEILPFRKHS